MKTRLIELIVCLSVFNLAYSQDDCLTQASIYFNDGRFSLVENTLTNCIGSLSKESRARAYEILTQTYLANREYLMADSKMLERLECCPNYELIYNHDPELKRLYNGFRTRPIMTIGVQLGLSLAHPIFKTSESTFSNGSVTKLSGDPRICGGISFNYLISPKLFMGSGINYLLLQFRRTQIENETTTTQSHKETQQRIALPILLGLTLPLNQNHDNNKFFSNLGMNVFVGTSLEIITSNKIVELNLDFGKYVNLRPLYEPVIDIIDYRRKFQPTLTLGFSLSKYFKSLYLVELLFTYNHSYTDQSLQSYIPLKSLITLGYVDNSIQPNYFTITIRSSKLIYKPKKYR